MKRIYTILVLSVLVSMLSNAQERTLRIDYIFSGTSKSADISLDMMSSGDGWAGRRVNMDMVPLKGNGQIWMTDLSTGKVLYRNAFSTLFQEWQATEEATRVRKSFEAVFLLPMPPADAKVTVELYDSYGSVMASLSHVVNPSDILIRRSIPAPAPFRYIRKSGTPQECIDVAVVAEGYTAAEAELFYEDAAKAVDAILSYAPFDRHADKFNFVAVALESKDSGVSVPSDGLWKDTAVGSNYDTFYMDRYLTTLHVKQLHDKLEGIPYEHIVILANSDTYGGGGIYNFYTLTTSRHSAFAPVVTHEFGHSFGGLGDEYYYDDQYADTYHPVCEPWEQNITTLSDFSSKWEDMLPEGTPIPTFPKYDDKTLWQAIAAGEPALSHVGVYEGGGYHSKGVYRPFPDCLMKTLPGSFCPVCQRALENVILFHLQELPR